ncbi:MAG: protein kinase [Vicinamibacteraceae bacterium]
MGQVYRARDSKLGRQVALKVLPAHFANDPERRARFLREARVLATLNHPHIAGIYGLEDSGSVHALVLELVEGPTLADRLASGPLPLDEALAIAASVIDALEAAHDAGIIHRDLKPANIKVRGDDTVKVLDFGLARLVLHDGQAPPDHGAAPTLTSPAIMTTAGTVLGTAAYMSPEQAKGRVADARSDVWAFGCVLYEMLAGCRPFAGEDIAETLAAVLRTEPDWTALPANTPASVHGVLRRCLQKDRKRRFAAIADVRLDLQEPIAVGQPGPGPARLPWLVAGAAVLLALVAWRSPWSTAKPPTEAGTPLRFTVAPPSELAFGGPMAGGTGNSAQLAMSPDGQHIAFVAGTPSGYRLYLRSLTSLTATALPGTEGATYPFWAPDSSAIGFFANGKVKRKSIGGGPPVVLADAPSGRGGTWNREGVLLFTPTPQSGVRRAPSETGPEVDVAVPQRPNAGLAYRWPSFLPDGRHFLYTVAGGACCPPMRPGMIRVGSLDPAEPSIDVVEAESSAFYAAGHLVFAKDATLFAQPFDLQTFRLSGEPVLVGERVSWEGSRYVSASVSDNGTLVFGTGAEPIVQQATWFNRGGHVVGPLANSTQYHSLSLSPDERHAAVALQTGSQSSLDLWLFDVTNGNSSRLTAGPGLEGSPVWSPDGRRLAFQNERDGKSSIHVLTLDGRTEETLLDATAQGNSDVPTSWSRDGFLAFTRRDASGHTGVWVLPLDGDRTPTAAVQGADTTTSGRFSPDGHWLAFTLIEHGSSQVFVQAFPGTGVKHPVTREDTSHPVWRSDGKELYVLSVAAASDGVIVAIPIDLGTHVETGVPQHLFLAGAGRFSDGQIYAVTRAGDRFLINARPRRPSLEPLTVIVNWPALLRPPR